MRNLLTTVLILLFSLGQSTAQLSIEEIMYNNPGEDIYEYVKIWNTSNDPIDISNLRMDSGFQVDFPSVTIPGQNWFFVVADSAAFADLDAFQGDVVIIEGTGALNNGGETIRIIDTTTGETLDEVTYDDGNGWPTFADGDGPALVWCGGVDKNNPDEWTVQSFPFGRFNEGVVIDDQPVYGLLQDIGGFCNGKVSFFSLTESVLESDGIVNIPVYVDLGMEEEISLTISAENLTTDVSDFNLITSTFTIDTDTMDVINIQIEILDDAVLEMNEQLVLSFVGVANNYDLLTSEITINIIDNDIPLTEDLIITGVWDAQPGFGGTKGAEFYALNNIPDLSIYGVGVVNNGNGTDGVEFTFASQSLAAGSFIYLAEDSAEFADYYGFAPDFIFPSINVNGDDAIELFENAQPLDVFGDVDMDGTGTTWEYQDGWAYRNSGTGPDGNTFLVGNWTYGGIDALDGPISNSLAPIPFPIGIYSEMEPTEVLAEDDVAFVSSLVGLGDGMLVLEVTSNDQIPGDIVDLLILGPPNANITVTDTFTVVVNIDEDFCGDIIFDYSVSNGNSQDEAQVTIMVECPIEFPLLDIGIVTTEDAMGVADSIGTTCELRGTVYGVNLSDSGALFTIIDGSRNGIAVFTGNPDIGYTVSEGDEVSVRGAITQFNGLTEIIAEEIELLFTGAQLLTPIVVTNLGENTESNLVQIENVQFVDAIDWGGGTSGFNVTVVDGNSNEFVVRVDNNVDLFLLPVPDDAMGLNITGIGGQFDNSNPLDGDYQLFPRYEADIETFTTSTLDVLSTRIDMYPNPTNKTLNFSSEAQLDMVRILDALGRVVYVQERPEQQLEIQVAGYARGIYTVQAIKEDAQLTMKLFVQ